jgi:hypothetical protein
MQIVIVEIIRKGVTSTTTNDKMNLKTANDKNLQRHFDEKMLILF